MNKYNLKKQNNQASNKHFFLNRQMRRCRAFRKLAKEGMHPALLYDYLYSQKKLDTISYKILQYILTLASKNMHAWPSVDRLQDYCAKNGKRPHAKSISRVTKDLSERGFIRKWGRGFKRSVALLLNPFFNNPVLQYMIAPLFSFMALASFAAIYPTASDCREGFVYRNICSFATHVTYNKYTEYLLKKRTEFSVSRQQRPSKRGGFYNARASTHVRESTDPKKGMQSISSIIKNVLGSQQPEFIPTSKPILPAPAIIKKPFVLPEQPKTVGDLLALQFKEREQYESNFEGVSRKDSQPFFNEHRDPFSDRYHDPLEDESVWQDADGDDYT